MEGEKAGDAVAERKKRLRELREKAQGQEQEGSRTLKFRNYRPLDKKLYKKSAENDEANKHTADTTNAPEDPRKTQEPDRQARSQAKLSIVQQELLTQDGDALLSIVPTKPNWDLKRDVEKRLEKLKNRTFKAIVKILKEKMLDEEENDEEEDDGEDEQEYQIEDAEASADNTNGHESEDKEA